MFVRMFKSPVGHRRHFVDAVHQTEGGSVSPLSVVLLACGIETTITSVIGTNYSPIYRAGQGLPRYERSPTLDADCWEDEDEDIELPYDGT
jgi:hypothetical protein